MMKIKNMSPMGLIRRVYNASNKHFIRATAGLTIQTSVENPALLFLGEGDGAWPIIKSQIPEDAICYCVGVGVNATFDIGLSSLGFEVHSFDPTPRALKYAESTSLEQKGPKFHPLGIWNTETTLKFYAPSNAKHANFSAIDLHGTNEFVEAKCYKLSQIMEQLGHSHVDLMKLDVEGSWYPILKDMLDDSIFPTLICVEFDSPTTLIKVQSTIKSLKSKGYKLAWREQDNYLFTRA